MNTEKNTPNKGNTVLLVIGAIFALASVGMMVWNMMNELDAPLRVLNILSIMVCGLTIYYGVSGYKIPHGNVMKTCFLAYAFLFASNVFWGGKTHNAVVAGLLIATILSAFMAGRLNKRNRNAVIFAIVAVILFANAFMVAKALTETVSTVLCFSQSTLWCTMGCAYLARFGEHKEAGKTE